MAKVLRRNFWCIKLVIHEMKVQKRTIEGIRQPKILLTKNPNKHEHIDKPYII